VPVVLAFLAFATMTVGSGDGEGARAFARTCFRIGRSNWQFHSAVDSLRAVGVDAPAARVRYSALRVR